MHTLSPKWSAKVALPAALLCVVVLAKAYAQDKPADSAPFPFALNVWYEFNVAGADLSGNERFQFVDATRSDERPLYRLESVLSLKRRDGAYRKHETSLTFTAKGTPVSYYGKSDALFPDSPGDTGAQTFSFDFLSAERAVHVKIDHSERPRYRSKVFDVPRETFALDRQCFSHFALLVACNAIEPNSRKAKMDVFSLSECRPMKVTLEYKGTEKTNLAGSAVDLVKVRVLVNKIPIGTFLVRQSDRTLIYHTSQDGGVRVALKLN